MIAFRPLEDADIADVIALDGMRPSAVVERPRPRSRFCPRQGKFGDSGRHRRGKLVSAFYATIGYELRDVIVMGRRDLDQ
jgi:hypothetical protein